MVKVSYKIASGEANFATVEVVLNALQVPAMVVDVAENLIHYNRAAREQLSYFNLGKEGIISIDDIEDQTFTQFLRRKINCISGSGKSSKGKLKFTSHLSHDKYFEISFSWLIKSHLILAVFTDVSREIALKNRIESIRKSLAKINPGKSDENVLFNRLNQAVMQSANTIVITNLDGDIVFANPRFEKTTGYTFQEAYMKNPRILKSGDQPAAYYEELWKTISSGKVWKGEFKNLNKQGTYYWESATITPIRDASGKVTEYLAIKEEITERKHIEEKLERTLMEMEVSNWEYKVLNEDLKGEVDRRNKVEKELKFQKQLLQELNENLESQIDSEVKKNREKDELMLLQSRQAAMGEMIGNIAHQWRQPLNAIGLMVYDLTDAYRFGELTEDYLNQSEKDIKSVLDHMSQTIDDFRNFFKPNKEKQVFQLSDVIKTSVSFVEATLKNSGIRLITEVSNDISLFGYPNEFAQVLLNIINNARDAILEKKPQNQVIRIVGNKTDKKAMVRVIDSGGGIPTSVLHKIFDPYFTTKEQGKGTGVGLYMSKTIVERNMGGTIFVRNTRTGAEFTIEVPVELQPSEHLG